LAALGFTPFSCEALAKFFMVFHDVGYSDNLQFQTHVDGSRFNNVIYDVTPALIEFIFEELLPNQRTDVEIFATIMQRWRDPVNWRDDYGHEPDFDTVFHRNRCASNWTCILRDVYTTYIDNPADVPNIIPAIRELLYHPSRFEDSDYTLGEIMDILINEVEEAEADDLYHQWEPRGNAFLLEGHQVNYEAFTNVRWGEEMDILEDDATVGFPPEMLPTQLWVPDDEALTEPYTSDNEEEQTQFYIEPM
jgi:hypothetical protein